MLWRPRMDNVIHLKIDASLFIVSSVHVVRTTFYCTSGIRAMSIQNESNHTQLDELRQTVADLSTKIQVLNETIRKGKTDLITN
jgi:cell division protein FtsL